MTWKLRWLAILASLFIVLPVGLASSVTAGNDDNGLRTQWPVELLDDDDWDDDDWEDDDDDWDDDDWDDDDDDWDDDDCDDDDDWDDDDCYFHDRTFDTALPNQAILQLQPEVNANDFAEDHGAAVLGEVEEGNLLLLQLDPNLDDQQQVNELVTDERVVWSELNYTSHAPEGRPRYFFTSSVLTSGFVDAPALPLDLNYTSEAACVDGSGIVIAVLDTGVDETHPLVQGNIIAGGVNTIDGTENVADEGNGIDDDADGLIDEMVGHGTHVSGSIMQVAPDARIMPFKVLNSDGVGTTFSVTAGIFLAVNQDVDVINLSLGTTFDSLSVRMAIDYAAANDVIVVAAAGNSNLYTPVEYPAALDSVISVASVNGLGDKSTFSNFHESVDISAPGENVASAYPGGQFLTASGTSMAAPLVSGTLILLLERHPDIATADIPQSLYDNSSPLNLGDPLLEGLMGAGTLNINAAIDCEPTTMIGGKRIAALRPEFVSTRFL